MPIKIITILLLTNSLLFSGCGEAATTTSGRTSATSPPSTTPKPSASPTLGDDVVLEDPDPEYSSVQMADDQETLFALIKISLAKDKQSEKRLVATGKLFDVKNGTKARVVDFGTASVQVFINEGRYKGRYAWLPNGCCLKAVR